MTEASRDGGWTLVRGAWTALILAVVALVVVAGLALFRPDAEGDPTSNSPEAGFARDMQVHHAQAVEMSFLLRERSSDTVLRTIAYDIITSQQQQMGQMFAWLELWGLPQTGNGPSMVWVGHGGHGGGPGNIPSMNATKDGLMPGMATPPELTRLGRLDGIPAERLWLRLMVRHHLGGVDMAKAVLARTERSEVRTLARAIIVAQQSEIDQMQQLLDDRRRAR